MGEVGCRLGVFLGVELDREFTTVGLEGRGVSLVGVEFLRGLADVQLLGLRLFGRLATGCVEPLRVDIRAVVAGGLFVATAADREDEREYQQRDKNS